MAKKKIILGRKGGLYLKDVGHKGRGVFCTSDIGPGSVLEVSPSIVLTEAATRDIDKTILANYTFVTGSISKGLQKKLHIKKTGDCSSVIMGIASFCNHGEKPNAEIIWEEQEGTVYHTLKATRRIPKGTEICTTYGRGWFKDRA